MNRMSRIGCFLVLTSSLVLSACGGDEIYEAEVEPGKADLLTSVCEMILSGDELDKETLEDLGIDAISDLFTKTIKENQTVSVTERLKLGACVGAYFSIWANINALKLSLSLRDGAQIENFSFFLAYSYTDHLVEAIAETELLREILAEDSEQRPQIFNSTFVDTPRHYIIHGPCPIPYSEQLAGILTRMMVSNDDLVDHLFTERTNDSYATDDYRRFTADIALVPISNIDPEYADCRD